MRAAQFPQAKSLDTFAFNALSSLNNTSSQKLRPIRHGRPPIFRSDVPLRMAGSNRAMTGGHMRRCYRALV